MEKEERLAAADLGGGDAVDPKAQVYEELINRAKGLSDGCHGVGSLFEAKSGHKVCLLGPKESHDPIGNIRGLPATKAPIECGRSLGWIPVWHLSHP